MRPKISIILPYKNEEKTIARALESIIDQTLTDWELIAIDDGSTDKSRLIVNSYAKSDSRIKSISCGITIGLPAALNIGIFCANADLIARADGDDINEPERLRAQYEFLINNPDIDIIGTGALLINSKGDISNAIFLPAAHADLQKFEIHKTKFFHSSVLIRRSFFANTGIYDIRCPRAQDKELWLRGLLNGARYANLNTPLIRYSTRGYVKSWKTILSQLRSNVYISRKYSIKYGYIYSTFELGRSLALKLRLFQSRSLKVR